MEILQGLLGLLAGLFPAVIPVLTPLVIAGVKKLAAALPTWLLPILAPAIGGLLDLVVGLLTGVQVGPLWAAVLGAAGVGVREIVDQIKKALRG